MGPERRKKERVDHWRAQNWPYHLQKMRPNYRNLKLLDAQSPLKTSMNRTAPIETLNPNLLLLIF